MDIIEAARALTSRVCARVRVRAGIYTPALKKLSLQLPLGVMSSLSLRTALVFLITLSVAAEDSPPQRKVIDIKKVFREANEGSLVFPSDEIKAKAGHLAWGKWAPKAGLVGEVIHTWAESSRHLLKAEGHYFVIAEQGLEDSERTGVSCGAHKAPTCAQCPDGSPKGKGHSPADWCNGDCIWNDYYVRCDLNPDLPAPENRTITNPLKALSTINEENTLQVWPSDAIKAQAGVNAWGDWRPANGMVGLVIHRWPMLKNRLLKIADGAGHKYVVMQEEGLFTAENRTISNPLKSMSGINEGDAVTGWPSDAIKAQAGKKAWGDWKPAGGMVGRAVCVLRAAAVHRERHRALQRAVRGGGRGG